MKVINVDIDGVIRYFLKSAHVTLRKYYPDKIPKNLNTTTEWNIEKHYPLIPKKELLNFLFHKKAKEVFLDNAKPFEGASQFIKKLRKQGYIVILNTHQNSETFKFTVEWLDKYKIKYDYLIYSIKLDKHIIPGILIDDKFENCRPGIDLLFTRPSNVYRKYAGTRVEGYQDILDYLKIT